MTCTPYWFGLVPLNPGYDRDRWEAIVRALNSAKRDGKDYYAYYAKHGFTVSPYQPSSAEVCFLATPDDAVFILDC